MPYQKELIRYLQNNDILALQLEKALKGVGEMVWDKAKTAVIGLKRASNYTACLTTSYQDICRQQGEEDVRFAKAVWYLIKNADFIEQMLLIYFKQLIKYKTYEQIAVIKKGLMAVNVYVATSSLTSAGFAFGVANAIVLGTKLSVDVSIMISARAAIGLAGLELYGTVQKAADSAMRLKLSSPDYYNALYLLELEMLYFIIEPLFISANAFSITSPSEQDIINIITKMAR